MPGIFTADFGHISGNNRLEKVSFSLGHIKALVVIEHFLQASELLQAEIDQIEHLDESYETIHQMATNRGPVEELDRPLFYSMLTLEYGIK